MHSVFTFVLMCFLQAGSAQPPIVFKGTNYSCLFCPTPGTRIEFAPPNFPPGSHLSNLYRRCEKETPFFNVVQYECEGSSVIAFKSPFTPGVLHKIIMLPDWYRLIFAQNSNPDLSNPMMLVYQINGKKEGIVVFQQKNGEFFWWNIKENC